MVRNQTEFADLIEINRTTLSSAMNGRPQALTDSLVAKATKVANELTSRMQEPEHTVPIVPYAVRGGALQGFSEGVEEWECERITSPVRGAELAFEVTGDSMAPGFPAGTRVLLKRVRSMIAWGEVHVIDTVDGPVLKRIDQGEGDTFILRSDNPAYQPIVVSREDIRGVWRVLLRMIQ
jgi:phage repressor protein C with HTH and peptisase S24 domain